MAEDAAGKGAGDEATEKQQWVLLIIIASDPDTLDELITGMLDVGLGGATVIESKGLGAILRDEMPIFAGLAAMIPQRTGSRVMLSVTSPERAASAFEYFENELEASHRPIAFTIPVVDVCGLRAR